MDYEEIHEGDGGGLYVGDVPEHLVEEFRREWNEYQLSHRHIVDQKEIMFMANVVLPYVRSKWGTLHNHLINLTPRVRKTVYPHILPII